MWKINSQSRTQVSHSVQVLDCSPKACISILTEAHQTCFNKVFCLKTFKYFQLDFIEGKSVCKPWHLYGLAVVIFSTGCSFN